MAVACEGAVGDPQQGAWERQRKEGPGCVPPSGRLHTGLLGWGLLAAHPRLQGTVGQMGAEGRQQKLRV